MEPATALTRWGSFYENGRCSAAKLLTKREARRAANQFARLLILYTR
jgi:hypothetical protein